MDFGQYKVLVTYRLLYCKHHNEENATAGVTVGRGVHVVLNTLVSIYAVVLHRLLLAMDGHVL